MHRLCNSRCIQFVEKVCFFKKVLVLNPYPQTPFPGKGADTSRKLDNRSLPATRAYCTNPQIWQAATPKMPIAILSGTRNFSGIFLNAIPLMAAIAIKPIINPPVGPTIEAIPPLKPLNTGTPTAPSRT